MGEDRRESRHDRIFRFLLRLFPFEFRSDYGRDMAHTFSDQRQEAELKGAPGILRLWWPTLAGILTTAPREHWDMMRQDGGFALRLMRKNPGFTLVVVLTLALGIGANTAIFSFVDALFLKPLPVPNAEEIVRIYAKAPSGHYGAGFSYPEYEVLRDHASTLAALAVEAQRPQLHLVSEGDSVEVRGEFVSANYFNILGIEPRVGRGFLAQEDQVPGRNAVTVISDGLWKARFHADPGVIGREVQINGAVYQVIGVAPPEFYGDLTGSPVEVWIPSMMYGAAGFGCTDGTLHCSLFDGMIGRLAPRETAVRAQAEAGSVMVWSATDWEKKPGHRQLYVTASNGESPDEKAEDAAQMRLLMTGTAVLLLIACLNLAGLLLARGVMRRKEIAVRLSLGAGRLRVVRQLLMESLMLAVAGGAIGTGFSFAGTRLLSQYFAADSEGFSHRHDLSFDWRVLAYSMTIALVTGVVFGTVPAIRASRQDLVTELKEGGSSDPQTKGWLGHGLVIGQIALSVVLVISASLLVRSGAEAERGTNFEPSHMVVLRLRPELTQYSPQQMEALVHRVKERVGSRPGIQSFAFMQGGEGLVWNWQNGRDVQVKLPGESPSVAGAAFEVRKQDVSPEFFKTLRIPLLQGREFEDSDRPETPRVAILNEALARHFWPDQPAVGRAILINEQAFQVIGVCANIQPANSLEAPRPHLYLSYWQSNATREGDVRIAVRTAGDPANALPAIRKVVRSIDPAVPVGEDMSMDEQVRLEYSPVLLARSVMTYCGLLALSLSAMGLYSILAFAVRTRTREIGIRMALGARAGNVIWLLLGQGTKLGLMGVATGVLAALSSTRLLASLIFGVAPTDPGTFIGVAILLLLVALGASYFPARRATRIDPMTALRAE